MKFFFSPFIFIYELIAFLVQAVFVYGLALIAVAAFIAYAITTLEPRYETIVKTEIVPIVETVYVPIIEKVEEVTGLVCERFDGCRVEWDKFGTEFCPTCVNK